MIKLNYDDILRIKLALRNQCTQNVRVRLYTAISKKYFAKKKTNNFHY